MRWHDQRLGILAGRSQQSCVWRPKASYVASLASVTERHRFHDDGAPAWFATSRRIEPAELAGPVSDPVS
jgi:hypothetical protein